MAVSVTSASDRFCTGFVVFVTGELLVTTQETLPPIGPFPGVVLTRSVVSSLPWTVTFPISVTFGSTVGLTVSTPIVGALVSAAITSQVVSSPFGGSPQDFPNPFGPYVVATVNLETIAVAPWTLSTDPGAYSIISVNPSVGVILLATSGTCSVGPGGSCVQQWTVILLPTTATVFLSFQFPFFFVLHLSFFCVASHVCTSSFMVSDDVRRNRLWLPHLCRCAL
jgi:hypothetical protein